MVRQAAENRGVVRLRTDLFIGRLWNKNLWLKHMKLSSHKHCTNLILMNLKSLCKMSMKLFCVNKLLVIAVKQGMGKSA